EFLPLWKEVRRSCTLWRCPGALTQGICKFHISSLSLVKEFIHVEKNANGSRRDFLKKAGIAGLGIAATSALPKTANAAAAQQSWDSETDVIVVGSGYAGLCAAIEAADAGAQVVIIEKEPVYGG